LDDLVSGWNVGVPPTLALGVRLDTAHMDDTLSPRDRYACAVRARDLTSYPASRFAPADVIAAAGMAAQRQGLGMMLQRLRADARSADRCVVEVALAVRLREAVRRREVRRDGAAAEVVVAEALAWWLQPTCQECTGVRFDRASGSNRLTARHCKACGGSGARRIESSAPDAARWVIDCLSQLVDRSEGAHRRKMR